MKLSDIDISIHTSDETKKEVIFNTRSASMALTNNQLCKIIRKITLLFKSILRVIAGAIKRTN